MSSAQSHHEPPLVLVVDDFEDNREMFAEYLELSGFQVAQAGTGRDAISRAFALVPDVVLMDLSLPELDGWEATRILHADPRTKDIPIVVLTGTSQPDQKKRAEECGAMLVLTKPCSPSDLYEVLRDVLEKAATSARAPKSRR